MALDTWSVDDAWLVFGGQIRFRSHKGASGWIFVYGLSQRGSRNQCLQATRNIPGWAPADRMFVFLGLTVTGQSEEWVFYSLVHQDHCSRGSTLTLLGIARIV